MITAASPSAEMAPLEIIDAAAPSGDAAELSDELHAGSGRAQVPTRFDHERHKPHSRAPRHFVLYLPRLTPSALATAAPAGALRAAAARCARRRQGLRDVINRRYLQTRHRHDNVVTMIVLYMYSFTPPARVQ